MFPELRLLRTVAEVLVDRLRAARADERGMTTETVIITALLAAAALLAMGIIAVKIDLWANDVPDPAS